MIIPAILSQKYENYRVIVEIVANKAKETLQKYCDNTGYAFASRLKTIESLAEKIETGRYKSWSDLDDLFACTIIIPTLSQEEVSKFCKSAFNIKNTTKRGQVKKAPDVFRFDSTRIYAQLLKPEGLEIPEHPNIYDIVFEIQIKTAFEHAWSVSTHDLVYKGPDIDWKRHRLAAQIKATVEQLDTLILAFNDALPHISENSWPEIKVKQKISAKMKQFIDKSYIPSECLPKDLSRFCNNFYILLQSVDPDKVSEKVNTALKAIESELSKKSNIGLFPRSISLFQYFLAILVKKQVMILPDSGRYFCNISEELLQIYPELNIAKFRFDYESGNLG
jgi:ppGpp synthetase/RelA/SpoT-type nucleotidyltranferase